MRRLLCMTLIAMMLLMGSVVVAEPLQATNRSDLRYPEVDVVVYARYEMFEDELLPAKLLTFVDAEGITQYRILVEYDTLDDDGNIVDTVAGLFRAEMQGSIIHEEGKPDYLVTVCAEAGVVDDTELFEALDNLPEATEEPEETPEPGTTPKPGQTQKPKTTPKPGTTPKPTAKPTDSGHNWTCKECGKSFGDDYDAWYQHAWYNPGHYNSSPTENPGGYWEEYWVVDVPEQGHTEYVCNGCGARFDARTQEAEFDQHGKNHALNGEPGNWHNEYIVDVPEQGHWEKRWVPTP